MAATSLRTIEPGQNAALHGLLNELGMTEYKGDLISRFTGGRTVSSKDLLYAEAKELIEHLRTEKNSRTKAMRGKITHFLCLMGYVDGDGEPDWNRINNFVKSLGKNNPAKRTLINLKIEECRNVLNQVQAMYQNTIKPK